MKTGRTLPSLAAELQRQASVKNDFLAPADRLAVRSNGHSELIVSDAFPINETAHAQLAEYLGIPQKFYDRLRSATRELRVPLPAPLPPRHPKISGSGEAAAAEDAPLYDVVVNRLLQAKAGDVRLIRTLDGTARAFLSDSYSLDLDHLDVFVVAAKAMEEAGICPEDVLSCEVTERKLYLKVVSPRLEAVIHPENLKNPHGLLKEPQVVQAGFVLTNSEVGLGSLSIQQTVYKLMCTNLWTVEEQYKRRHLGRVLEANEEGEVYRSDTRQAMARAELMKIRDHIASALSETCFKLLVDRMQETAGVRLEGSIEKAVEVTARKLGLNQFEREETLKHLIEGADLSLWGLTNAVTQTASTAVSYDRASELETAGGRLFSLTKPEIREIVQAV